MGDWTDVVIAVPAIVNLAFAFAFGACAGSFIHVLVHRMPQGLSVISPPSRCPTCGHRLAWHENVPIVSWLRLRGRCSACGTDIPSRYVWSEVGVGVLFALAYAVLLLPRPETFWFPVGEGWWREQGAARALCELSTDNRKPLKTEGHLSRDPRAKERRKYGLKKARKAPQFSKR